MTENKRFTMCHEQNDINGWTMSIVDWETKEPFDYTTYEVHSSSITDTKDEMEDLCLLLNELSDENGKLKIFLKALNEELSLANRDYDTLEEEYDELKSTIAQLIEENRKNNDLLLSDIRILEKALWCSGCANDYGRLKELRKEFMR